MAKTMKIFPTKICVRNIFIALLCGQLVFTQTKVFAVDGLKRTKPQIVVNSKTKSLGLGLPVNGRVIDDMRRLDLDIERPVLPEVSEPCEYSTADELMQQCPTQDEIRMIRRDFNISFKNELVENGVLAPWACTNGGRESSIMLSMYNSFRLAKCINFDRSFPWSPEHNNLYEWLKSARLSHIGYFWADDESRRSHASISQRTISIIGNNLNSGMYRSVIEPRNGVGLIHKLVLLAHETAHVELHKGHNCGTDDTNLDYMGAWSVQYYLLKMLSTATGEYFSEYQRATLQGDATWILNTRFCERD